MMSVCHCSQSRRVHECVCACVCVGMFLYLGVDQLSGDQIWLVPTRKKAPLKKQQHQQQQQPKTAYFYLKTKTKTKSLMVTEVKVRFRCVIALLSCVTN